jgi:hypothetical protein
MEVVVFKQVKTPMDMKQHNSQQANNRDLIVSNKQRGTFGRVSNYRAGDRARPRMAKLIGAVGGEQLSTTMYLTDDGIGIDR